MGVADGPLVLNVEMNAIDCDSEPYFKHDQMIISHYFSISTIFSKVPSSEGILSNEHKRGN